MVGRRRYSRRELRFRRQAYDELAAVPDPVAMSGDCLAMLLDDLQAKGRGRLLLGSTKTRVAILGR